MKTGESPKSRIVEVYETLVLLFKAHLNQTLFSVRAPSQYTANEVCVVVQATTSSDIVRVFSNTSDTGSFTFSVSSRDNSTLQQWSFVEQMWLLLDGCVIESDRYNLTMSREGWSVDYDRDDPVVNSVYNITIAPKTGPDGHGNPLDGVSRVINL